MFFPPLFSFDVDGGRHGTEICGIMKTQKSCRYEGLHPPTKKWLSWNSFGFITDAPLKRSREGGMGGRESIADTFGGVQAGLQGNPSSEDSWFILCNPPAPTNTRTSPPPPYHTHTSSTSSWINILVHRLVKIAHTFRRTEASHLPNKTLSSPNYLIAQMVLLQTRRLW